MDLLALFAAAFRALEEKRVEPQHLLSLLTLLCLLGVIGASSPGGCPEAGLAGLAGGLLGEGGKAPEALLGLLQRQGKKLPPQLLASLLSLLGGEKGASAPGS